MKCPKDARKYWAEVLRTDRFKQGIGRLEYIGNDGNILNCCLGVACRLYMEDGGELKTELVDHEYFDHKVTKFDDNDAALPDSVINWLGLNDSRFGRFYDANGRLGFLDTLNDLGTSFSEISNIIDSGQLDTLDDNASDEQEIKEPNN